MEILVAVALFLGIVFGVAWAIAGTNQARLRRALSYQADAAAKLRAEVDLLRRTMAIYDAAIARNEHRISEAEAKRAAAERDAALCRQGEMAADAEVERLATELSRRDDTIDQLRLRLDDLRRQLDERSAMADNEDLGDVGGPLPAGVVVAVAIAGDDDAALVVPVGQDGVSGAVQVDIVLPAGEADIMAWRRMRKPRQPKAEPVPADHVDGQPPTSGAWPQEWIGGEIHDTDAESTVLLCRDGKATFYRWDGKCWSSTEVPATVQIMCNGTLVPQSAFFASKGIPSQPQHMTIPPAPWPHPDPAFILVEEPRLIVLPPVPAEELMRRSDLVRQQATARTAGRWSRCASSCSSPSA